MLLKLHMRNAKKELYENTGGKTELYYDILEAVQKDY